MPDDIKGCTFYLSIRNMPGCAIHIVVLSPPTPTTGACFHSHTTIKDPNPVAYRSYKMVGGPKPVVNARGSSFYLVKAAVEPAEVRNMPPIFPTILMGNNE
jgi:hypothetical protein